MSDINEKEFEQMEERHKELLRIRINIDNAKIWKLEDEVKKKDLIIESLKAITELAVKGLEDIVDENIGFPRLIARETLSEIERLPQ